MAHPTEPGTIMKPFALRSFCILLLLPAWVAAADQPMPPDTAERAMVAMPISMAEPETRDPTRLRDSLRQPFAEEIESNKPYRLSAQERHRLREQLRGIPSHVQSQK